MQLATLITTGWMAFRDRTEISFEATNLIRGPNNAGKSCILDAIRFAITGTTRRGIRYETDVIHCDADAAEVILTIRTPAGDDITITRVIRRAASKKTVVTAGDITTEGKAAQARIYQLLGTSAHEYDDVNHIRQGMVAAIADADTSKRRAILFAWMRDNEIDEWARARSKAVKARTAARSALEQARARRDVLAQQVVEIPDAIDTRGIGAELRALQAELRLSRRRETIERERREVTAREQQMQDTPVAVAPDQPRDHLAGELASKRREVTKLKMILDKGFDGHCPVMGAGCPAASEVSASRETIQRNHDEISGAVTSIARERRDIQGEWKTYDTITRKRENEATSIAALRARLEDLPDARDVATIQAEVNTLNQERDAGIAAQARRRDAIKTRDSHRAVVESIPALETEYSAATAVLRAIDAVPGPGVTVAREIELEANQLLRHAGLSVAITWDRPTKDPVPECLECGHVYRGKRQTACPDCGSDRPKHRVPEIGIMVDDGRQVADVRVKSGMVRQMVGVALRLAAAARSSIDWVVLDEIDGAMRPQARDAVARLIRDGQNILGLQVCVVTQHDDTAQRFGSAITVVPGLQTATITRPQ
jgi:DNA repair exonuclease SbcCD ATPase subunit